MASKKRFVYYPLFMVLGMWIVYAFEIRFSYNFNYLGILPRTLKGLVGILFSPFLHGDAKHLFNNTVPLLVTLGFLYYFYKQIAQRVFMWGWFLTGILTWIIARPSYHIGASGIIYFLVSFLFFSGIIRNYYRLVALSLVVVFLYGSLVWYIFPTEGHISWEGHLSGFLMGLLLAFLYKNEGPKPERFKFYEDPTFDAMFDENGNFIPPEQESQDGEKDTSEKAQ